MLGLLELLPIPSRLGLLELLPIPSRLWESVSLVFITNLLKMGGGVDKYIDGKEIFKVCNVYPNTIAVFSR